MKNILVFGNSHVARVALSYAQHRSARNIPRDLRFDFISAPGPIAHYLQMEGKVLKLLPRPDRWNNRKIPSETLDKWYLMASNRIKACSNEEHIDTSVYDAIFYLGGGLLKRWRLLDMCLRDPGYSSGCAEQLAADLVKASDFYRCMSVATDNFDASDITVVFEPIQNELAASYETESTSIGPFLPVQEIIKESVKRIGFSILPFPIQLLNSAGNAVAARFHSGRETDFMHLNPSGANHVLQALISASPGAESIVLPSLD